MRKIIKKYNFGGDLKKGVQMTSPLLNFIPGVGPLLSMGSNLATSLFENGGQVSPEYEAENKEVIMGGNPQVMSGGNTNQISENAVELQGNTHNEGGINTKGGDYIFSNKLKPIGSKKTFANIAKGLNKKLSKLEKIKDLTQIDKKTYELTKLDVDNKLGLLAQEQEIVNPENKTNEFKNGGKLPKYKFGGGNPPNPYLNTDGPVSEMLPENPFLDPLFNSEDYPGQPPTTIEKMQPSVLKPLNNLNGNKFSTNNTTTQTPLGYQDDIPFEMRNQSPNIDTINPMEVNIPTKSLDQLPRTELGNMENSNNPFQLPENTNNVLSTAATLAPTLYNLGQGIFGKKDYYKGEQNTMKDEALGNLERSLNYEVGDQLEASRRGYQSNLRNINNLSRGNSGEGIRGILSAQNLKQQQDSSIYGNKARYESDANRSASQIKLGLGEQDRAENKDTQLKQLQLDALKRRFLSTGLEGVSGYNQMNTLNNNRQKVDQMKVKALQQMYPYTAKYYFNDEFFNQ